MKKRKATRIIKLDREQPSNVFLTVKNKQIYVLIYRYCWQIIQCPGGVIQASKQIRKYIEKSDGEKIFVYAVSERAIAIGRINLLTLQRSSNVHNKHAIEAMKKIYNWINGYSLECLTHSKIQKPLNFALVWAIQNIKSE